MASRMDKYKKSDTVPARSNKNKELYKQIYNAYDDFENLVVPSNAKEIDISDLKKEITSREEYRNRRDYNDITNGNSTRKRPIKLEKIEPKEEVEDDSVYDINELLHKAVKKQKGPQLIEPNLASDDYLKKLKLDGNKTNIEQVKEMYEEIQEESLDEDESLLKTANLSLEILSDLKSDNDSTRVSAPIKNEALPEDSKENDFYSSTYKFSKRDFEGKEETGLVSKKNNDDVEEDDKYEDEFKEKGNGKFFFKILLLIFGIALIAGILIYIFNYLNRV